MGNSCVPVFPNVPRDPFPGPGTHPVPIALGEVSKLSEIEQTRVGSHFECVRETRWEPRHFMGPADPDPIAGTALRVTLSPGVLEHGPTGLRVKEIAYPNWEFLGPAVVIRRRPKRV